jgi:hypothetical protein
MAGRFHQVGGAAVNDTLKLPADAEPARKRRNVYQAKHRPYVDLGLRRYQQGGSLLLCKDPPRPLRVTLTMEQLLAARRRHNSLQPALQPTDRILLRWGESGGNGLPNPEAEIRETHYDPLPPDLHQRVDDIVDGSPWEKLTRKWYRTSLTNRELAEVLGVGKTQLYVDWGNSLWYYRGRFESERVYG